MAPPFGRKNPRPVYKTLVLAAQSKHKSKLKPEPNTALYAYIGGAIALLILGAVFLHR
jgi:hypothetical protein